MYLTHSQFHTVILLAGADDTVRTGSDAPAIGTRLPESPPEKSVIEYLEALPKRALIELAALVFMGRGDFSDFDSAQKQAESLSVNNLPEYLIESRPLDAYLVKGLAVAEGFVLAEAELF